METVRAAYSRMADQYIGLFADGSLGHPDDLDLIARHLSAKPGRILDVGCGPGHLTDHLRSLGTDALGIDQVPEFIDHARLAYPDCDYELGSMRQLDVPDASVAGVLAWYSLIHLPPGDLGHVLTELRRVLVSGGALVVGFFESDEIEAFGHKVTTAYYWPADELSARLDEAGFREVERVCRPGVHESGRRPHAVIAATAF